MNDYYNTTFEQRIEHLKDDVQEMLPELEEIANSEAEMVILHQDAFAADYQDNEYMLLGMAVKYLGLKGKEIRIIGTNRETL